MRWGRSGLALAVACGLALGGCGGGGDDDPPSASEPSEPVDVTREPGDDTEPAADPADPAASIVTIETPLATGTGLVFEEGYVVTTAAVVDPFFAVDVHVAGDPRPASVAGVDLVTGLAVLGPVDLSGTPATSIDPGPVERQADVSLYVGAEPGDDGAPTVVEGTVDALDSLEDWPVGFIDVAVDREIETPGAPVVDAAGQVIGLGGFAVDDGIEVAIDGATALRSIESIREGDGEWPHIPSAGDAFEEQATLDLSFDGSAALYFPSDWHEGQQELTLPADADVQLEVVSHANEVLLVNPQAETAGLGADDGADLVEPSPDGTYELSYPVDDDSSIGVLVYLTVPEGAAGPTALEVTSPYDFVVADPVPDTTRIAAGKPAEGILGAFEDTARYTVELAAGDRLSVSAASPNGDLALEVRDPGGAVVAEDEGSGGFLGLDPATDLTAEAAGSYEIRVRVQDGIATAYRLTVEP